MRDSQRSGLRLLAGPAYFARDSEDSGLGLTARVDGAERIVEHLSFVFWAQAQLPPTNNGDRLSSASVGIGLRLW